MLICAGDRGGTNRDNRSITDIGRVSPIRFENQHVRRLSVELDRHVEIANSVVGLRERRAMTDTPSIANAIDDDRTRTSLARRHDNSLLAG